MLEIYLSVLDLCFFEVTEAFKNLSDDNTWRRPTPALLSVGELAGHMAYGEAVRFAGTGADGGAKSDLSDCRISSPLLHERYRYYPHTLSTTPSPEELALSSAEVQAELLRIHQESITLLRELNPDLETKAPHWGSTYRELLKYLIFHASYHTGQMYSVRHLLGEETPDN